jgi:tetratricopeptide (TPR) repeat protein
VSLLALIAAMQLTPDTGSAQAPPMKTLDSPQPPRETAPANANSAAAGPGRLDPVLAQARSLAENGRATEAEHNVRQYLSAQLNSADAHFVLGYIFFREIQEQAETAAISQSPAAANDTVSATVSGGTSRHRPNAANSAEDFTAYRDEKAKASLAEFTEGAKFQTPSAFDLKIIAFDYVLLEDYVDADKWLTKMLEWTPNDPEGWYHLGRTKYNENRFDEAVRAFQQSLRLDPHNVKAEDNLGLAFAGLGRIDEAAGAYENAIAWQKNGVTRNPGPYIDMGNLLLDQNRSTEAIAYLKQAIDISWRDFKAHELLGKAYSRLNQFSQAQSELEQAIALAPQNPSLPCMLGPIYRRQGLMDKAKVQLDHCTALNGTHSSPEIPRP